MDWFTEHKGFIATLLGVATSALAPKLGVPEADLNTFVMSVCGLVATYVASHNAHKAVIGMAEAKASAAQP